MRLFTTTALAAVLALPGIGMAQTDESADVQVEDVDELGSGQQAQGTSETAETGQQQSAMPVEQVISLDRWATEDIYADGWSADAFIDDMEVYGQAGDDIGDVEDLVVDAEGKLSAVIAEIGGFIDIGDTHVAVPWDQVQADFAGQRIVVPLTEDNVRDYDPFTHGLPATGYQLEAEQVGEEVAMGVDDVPTGPRAFRISELIGDYARIRGGAGQEQMQQQGQTAQQPEMQQQGQTTGQQQPDQQARTGLAAPMPAAGGMPMTDYGYVSDVIIKDDQVAAVVVEPRGAYGPGFYAYPYYGYRNDGWRPGQQYYDLPYTEEEVGQLGEFQYNQLEVTEE